MKQYTTKQGDTWDMIALMHYGDEMYLNVLIDANFEHRKTVIFPVGIVLDIPDVDTTSLVYDSALPIWKRKGSVT